MGQKRSFHEGKRQFNKRKKQKTAASEGSSEEVLLKDVKYLLRDIKPSNEEERQLELPEQHAIIELTVNTLSSTGDGLAEKDGRVYVVPFTAPGDTVSARVYQNFSDERYSLTDLVEVVTPSQHRTEQPKCQYFTQCSGCQFQHLPYSYQLTHKQSIVERAYRNFSNLSASEVPPIGETIGSPLQYGYRTKLTPHFEGPPGGRRDKRNGIKATWPEVPPIGFMKKGTRKTMDIEDCPIGTAAVRAGMKRERARVAEEIDKYQKGATLLLRESTEKLDKHDDTSQELGNGTDDVTPPIIEEHNGSIFHKTCITDHKATSTEYVDAFRFDNPAGAFFQNNNSILPVVTQYIRDHILEPEPSPDTNITSTNNPKIQHMIDAYCGSGFFTITLSGVFSHSIGIDISPQSIEYAGRNARLNGLPDSSDASPTSDQGSSKAPDENNSDSKGTRFLAADANALFASVDPARFPPAQTVVVIDPPRKGCDRGFVRQLLAYGPARICYVSCNVHTQARDVGWLVGGLLPAPEEDGSEKVAGLYEIESLRGFDFFPQTSHVEGVAFLRRRSTSG